MIIYLSGSFFIYILGEQLSVKEFNAYSSVTHILYILKNILFAIGMYIYSRHYIENKPHRIKSVPYLDLNL